MRYLRGTWASCAGECLSGLRSNDYAEIAAIRLLNAIEKAVPAKKAVDVILDNYAIIAAESRGHQTLDS